MSAEDTATKPVFCANCGERNPRTNRFCGSCGTPIVLPPEPTPQAVKAVGPAEPATPPRPTVAPKPAPVASTVVLPANLPTDPLGRERELDRLLTTANVQRMRAQILPARKTLEQALLIAQMLTPVHAAPVHEQRGDMLAAEERWPEARAEYEQALALCDGNRPSAERKLAEITIRISDEEALQRLGGALRGDDLSDILSDPRTGKRHAGLAMILSIIPGFGQFYCGQFIKGAVLLAVFVVALLVISVAPEKLEYLKLVGATMTMQHYKATVPAHLHVFGFVAFASWLYSVVDAPFTAQRMSSDDGPSFVATPMGNRSDWEP